MKCSVTSVHLHVCVGGGGSEVKDLVLFYLYFDEPLFFKEKESCFDLWPYMDIGKTK